VHLARELLFYGAMEYLRLKPLPYDTHALEPHISGKAVALHFEEHHAGYARKLLIAGKPEETASLERIIQTSDGAIFDNAAQIWNHDFYWRSMQPDGGGAPSGALNGAITRNFGSRASGLSRVDRCALDRRELPERTLSDLKGPFFVLSAARGSGPDHRDRSTALASHRPADYHTSDSSRNSLGP